MGTRGNGHRHRSTGPFISPAQAQPALTILYLPSYPVTVPTTIPSSGWNNEDSCKKGAGPTWAFTSINSSGTVYQPPDQPSVSFALKHVRTDFISTNL